MTDEPTTPDEDGEPVDAPLANWEFLGHAPTHEDVRALLLTLPDVWGLKYVDFIDYVQPLPQNKKVKKPHPTNPNLEIEDRVEAYTLYMGVAGRIKMLERAAEDYGWCVDFTPEPVTPTGIPGYLNHADRLVYRVYVEIKAPIGLPRVVTEGPELGRLSVAEYMSLGRKAGTAWVPATGGANAAGSNPYEKVETSALGRALGAWGFGVLPGSGIATVEEMQAIRGNRAYMDAEANATGHGGRRGRPS